MSFIVQVYNPVMCNRPRFVKCKTRPAARRVVEAEKQAGNWVPRPQIREVK